MIKPATLAARLAEHDAALDAGNASPVPADQLAEAFAWLANATDADIDAAMATATQGPKAAPVSYQIQIRAERPGMAAGETMLYWEAYQGLNATNDRAAQRCYQAWLATVTAEGRHRFRLAKLFANGEA